jgi:hypothetical protein
VPEDRAERVTTDVARAPLYTFTAIPGPQRPHRS